MNSLVRAQLSDTAETARRLMGCTSLAAVMSVQIDASARTVARMVDHGRAMARLSQDMIRLFGASRRSGH